jgi:hypothetical protein
VLIERFEIEEPRSAVAATLGITSNSLAIRPLQPGVSASAKIPAVRFTALRIAAANF